MKPSTFTEHQDGVIQRIRLLILVVVLAAFAAQGCQFPVCSSLFGQPKIPSSNPNVLLVEDSDTGVQTAERTSRSNVSRGYMLTRPCSQKVVNHNRNCNGSKKRGSNVKSGKPGGTCIKELKDSIRQIRITLSRRKTFSLDTNTKQPRISILTKICPNTNKGKVKFVLKVD